MGGGVAPCVDYAGREGFHVGPASGAVSIPESGKRGVYSATRTSHPVFPGSRGTGSLVLHGRIRTPIMIAHRWRNPCKTSQQAKGAFPMNSILLSP